MTAVASSKEARTVGAKAVASLRRSLSERLADLIRSDAEWARQAADVGLIDRAWLENPGANPVRSAPPTQVVQRFLERSSEQRPSVLSSLGLSALQAMSMVRADAAEEGATAVQVTVMFTDLEGFTRYTATVGDEAAAAMIAEHHRTVGPVIRSRGGRIVKRMGDGLMVAFAAPEAAVLAAVELLTTAPDPLRMRVGVHLGEAVASHDDLLGHVVNVTARITEHAKGGQALASTEVRKAVGDLPGVRFARARKVRLKGVEPMSVCPVEAT
ncbi:MAG: putative adenylate/guanylate cyclase [Acidimicrobiales bacterium]|nr:putative adenylate/guanylate cyclase [Acidimicrobiales bacterium]